MSHMNAAIGFSIAALHKGASQTVFLFSGSLTLIIPVE